MVLLTRLLFGLVAAFWLGAGGLVLGGWVDLGLREGTGVLGLLMVGNGVALGLAAVLSLRGRKLVDYSALLLVAANAILSVTDEVGALDIASLLLNGILLFLLIAGLRRASPRPPPRG